LVEQTRRLRQVQARVWRSSDWDVIAERSARPSSCRQYRSWNRWPKPSTRRSTLEILDGDSVPHDRPTRMSPVTPSRIGTGRSAPLHADRARQGPPGQPAASARSFRLSKTAFTVHLSHHRSGRPAPRGVGPRPQGAASRRPSASTKPSVNAIAVPVFASAGPRFVAALEVFLRAWAAGSLRASPRLVGSRPRGGGRHHRIGSGGVAASSLRCPRRCRSRYAEGGHPAGPSTSSCELPQYCSA